MEKFRDIFNKIQRANAHIKSSGFGERVALEEINNLIETTKSERSLIIQLNRLIRETEDLCANAIDEDDYVAYNSAVKTYKEFKESIQKGKK